MYFQIENTPEHVRRARQAVKPPMELAKEKCPRLILAPFSKHAQIVFDNVLIGSACERHLEVFNPSQQVQKIKLGTALPPELEIKLPAEWLEVEPNCCHCLSMLWTPTHPTAERKTIRFINVHRGCYDVTVLLKSVVNVKRKGAKGFIITPGKIKKKNTRSPVAVYLKKSEALNKAQMEKSFGITQSQQKYDQVKSNKENVMSINDHSIDSRKSKCPFGSPNSVDLKFDISEVFSNLKKSDETYDKSFSYNRMLSQNVLKPSNKQPCDPVARFCPFFDNLTFTPLKNDPVNKLDHDPKIILSVNSGSELDDSLDNNTANKENEGHSMMSVMFSQPPNSCWSVNHTLETPTIQVTKHPNTSSPKEVNSPNLSINTEISRISDLTFFPQRVSTEKKHYMKYNNVTYVTHEILDDSMKLNSDTYSKDSPNTPMEARFNQMNEIRTPQQFFLKDEPKLCRQAVQSDMLTDIQCAQNEMSFEPRYMLNDLRSDNNMRRLQSETRNDFRYLQNEHRKDVRYLHNDNVQPNVKNMHTSRKYLPAVSAWQNDLPGVSTLQNDVPRVRTWQNDVPGDSAWQNYLPGDSTWQNYLPGDSTWQNDLPGVSTLQNDVPRIRTWQNDVPGDSTWQNDVPRVRTWQNDVPGHSTWQNYLPGVSTLQNDVPRVRTWQNNVPEVSTWQNDLRPGIHSPLRCITPPLQSIPEESSHFRDTLDKTDIDHQNTFTMNRTFDKKSDRWSTAANRHESWSKKAIRTEPQVWKRPITHIKKSLKNKDESKMCNTNVETNRTIGNVYSQSTTVDPFLSTAYFYDEEAVENFETEFKRWLNCILTPPADLDSNIDLKIDFAKTWLENRNKEVPAAPTREQVSSDYHSSHRLGSLRRSARALLMSPEIYQVIQKLSSHMEKKLITIRKDRNLHLDIGLQKTIMELLLSYNPLWLRIGLEAIYGIVLPLRSNSDIDGLTTFIINRMFKNPFLKNKHSKSSAPNMLLPAYMEAIKKFTLKKFFTLVFFLDQAKKRKLIPHDPCLFCRNSVCKESREIIIRFTRELIAGVGDITKHLRPLGYVVSHKQTYLDEYKYAVHNIAVDIRDGIRLTKVMEIILMKDGLLKQLRTPAISRLQKIHNVQIALNALKDTNFVIVGDITANDIADGHREKTLSLLWQIIHQFRAPLFEKAANVIQTWWRCKYTVIVEERNKAERILKEQNNAAITIQRWWRRILRSRLLERKMQQVTCATIIIQKYWRRWLCRSHFLKTVESVVKIEEWYRSVKDMRHAKTILEQLKTEREELRHKSAIVIQSNARRWLCMKRYQRMKKAAVLIGNYYKRYRETKAAAIVIQRRYRALIEMRKQRTRFLNMKSAAILIQTKFRARCIMIKERHIYLTKVQAYIIIQRWFRASLEAKKIRMEYTALKTATITIQRYYKSHLETKKQREFYLRQKRAAVYIADYYKRYRENKAAREKYLQLRNATIVIQRRCRALIEMRKQRTRFLNMKSAAILIQTKFRARCIMIKERHIYLTKVQAYIIIQRWFRAYLEAKKIRMEYTALKTATITIQRYYKSHLETKKQREFYLRQKRAAVYIADYYKRYRENKAAREKYLQLRNATIVIQRRCRALIEMRKQRTRFLNMKSAAILIQTKFRARCIMIKERHIYLTKVQAYIIIQRWFRAYLEAKKIRMEYTALKTATITIQRYYKSHLETNKQRESYLRQKRAAVYIADYYKRYRENKAAREKYLQLRNATIVIQRRYRAVIEMRKQRTRFLNMKSAAILIQTTFRARCLMLKEKQSYHTKVQACIKIQRWFRAYLEATKIRMEYTALKTATITIQRYYKSHLETKKQRESYLRQKRAAVYIADYYKRYRENKAAREKYLQLHYATIVIQRRYRAVIEMRKQRTIFLNMKSAAILIQTKCRARCLMIKERHIYLTKVQACITIQRWFRAYLDRKKQKIAYTTTKENKAARKLQNWYRSTKRRIGIQEYLKQMQVKRTELQKTKEAQIQYWAASKIQALFRGHIERVKIAHDNRVAEIRRRWREGGLKSTQESMKVRNEEALEVLRNLSDIESVIKAFRSLELLTEVFPMMYHVNASAIVQRVYTYMAATNRSLSSVDMLKSAVSVLVNLTRYRVTGPKIYLRERISPILKFMLRFSKSEVQLFCIMATYLWLFSKYEHVKKDLTELLQSHENHAILVMIKGNIDRLKRMTINSMKNKFHTQQLPKHANIIGDIGVLPALEPDYGIVRVHQRRYFENAEQAINCLFHTYKL